MIEVSQPEELYVDHPLFRITGKVSSPLSSIISTHNTTTGSVVNWAITEEQSFICFAALRKGKNTIKLQHAFYNKTLTVHFKPRDTIYLLQPLYVVFDGDEGLFQAPDGVDCTIESACDRISLAIALLQTFTYKSVQESLGTEAKTFQTLLDGVTGLPQCKVFHSKLSRNDIFNMSECEVWKSLAKEIMSDSSLSHSLTTKYIAFLSCTRYDGCNWEPTWRHRDIIAATKGYVAIGKFMYIIARYSCAPYNVLLELLPRCSIDFTESIGA